MSCCLWETGVDVFTGDGRPSGDGVKLFRDVDDMLKSTEPNGKPFDCRTNAGNNGFRSNGGC